MDTTSSGGCTPPTAPPVAAHGEAPSTACVTIADARVFQDGHSFSSVNDAAMVVPAPQADTVKDVVASGTVTSKNVSGAAAPKRSDRPAVDTTADPDGNCMTSGASGSVHEGS